MNQLFLDLLVRDQQLTQPLDITIIQDNAGGHRSAFQLDASSRLSNNSSSSRRRRRSAPTSTAGNRVTRIPVATPTHPPAATASRNPSSRWDSQCSQDHTKQNRDTGLRTPLRSHGEDSDSETSTSCHSEDIRSLLRSRNSTADTWKPPIVQKTSSWPGCLGRHLLMHPRNRPFQWLQRASLQANSAPLATAPTPTSTASTITTSLKDRLESLRLAALQEFQSSQSAASSFRRQVGGVQRSVSLQDWLNEPKRTMGQAPGDILQSVLDDIGQMESEGSLEDL